VSLRAHVRLPRRSVALLLALLAFVVYANSHSGEFAFDDNGVIAENSALHDIHNLGTLVVSPYWPGFARENALYRPLTIATFAIDWYIWKGRPFGFHVTNVLAHVGVTFLLFLLLLRLGAPLGAAAIGGAIFAVHPVHTEAVASIVGRSELLAAGFVLAACLLFLQRRLPNAVRIGAIAACYALALGSKESAVMLPGLLALLGWLNPERGERLAAVLRREWGMFAALFVVLGAYLVLRYSVLGGLAGSLPVAFMRDVSGTDRLATAIRVWPEYLRLLVFPKNLVADYAPRVLTPTNWHDTRVWIALPLGLLTLGLAVAWRRRFPWAALAVLWFAIAILPVANLLFPVGVLLAERTLYVPSVAVAFAIPALEPWYRQLRLPARRLAIGLAAVLVCLGAARTWMRNPAWASTKAFYETLVREHPESYRSMWYAADMEMRQGNVDRSLEMYGGAFALMPHDQQLGSTYANELVRHGQPAEAERVVRSVFRTGVQANHMVLVQSLILLGKYDEAARELDIADGYFPGAPVFQTLRRLLAQVRSAR
jgi:tetratricopeptide (TPR) repeat protein